MTKIQCRGYTDHLNRRPAENICHAFDFAAWQECPLNNFVVVNLSRCGDGEAGQMLRRILHKFRDWYHRRTKQLYGTAWKPMWVYTLENPGGQAHCNWIVHIPAELQIEFDQKREKWVKRAAERSGPYDVHVQAVNPDTAKSLAKYILKGIDTVYVGYLHLQAYACPQGRIWGKRAGTSPAIGRSARRAAGFVAKRDRGARRPKPANDDARNGTGTRTAAISRI